jgi:hypothetical protein
MQVDQAEYISFTADGWTSTNNLDGFISLTAHWVTKDLSRQQVVLSLKSVPGSHTGQVIQDTLSTEMLRWKITDNRRVLMVRDNGSSMVKATDLMSINSQPCVIHTLQLVVVEGLKEQRAVLDTLAVGRSIVGHFRHSSWAVSRLEQIQREQLGILPGDELRVIQDVSTRWNSSYYMLERLLVLKNALVLYSTETDAIKVFTANQWDLSNKLVATLRPFEEKTREASRDSATIAMIIPTVMSLTKYLMKSGESASGLGSMRAAMLQSIRCRFDSLKYNEPLLAATTLHPAYKMCWFETDEMTVLAKDFILSEGLELHYKAQQAETNATGHGQQTQSTNATAPSAVDSTGGSVSALPASQLSQPSTSTAAATGKITA